jgi:hypothetical protein
MQRDFVFQNQYKNKLSLRCNRVAAIFHGPLMLFLDPYHFPFQR